MEASGSQVRQGPDFVLIYDELRALARRRLSEGLGGASLQATALVHEVWVKLSERSAPAARDDSHFYATAAQAMRWILVDRARRRRVRGPGGDVPPDQVPAGTGDPQAVRDLEALALDAALEKLERSKPRMAAVVLQRHFAGLGVEDTARVLGISTATVKREWRFARAWLLRELGPRGSAPSTRGPRASGASGASGPSGAPTDSGDS